MTAAVAATPLPEFIRLAWTSSAARAVWEPRLRRISAAWQRLEIESVRCGLRRCALTVVPAWRVFELGAALAPDYDVATVQTLEANTAMYTAFETRPWQPGARLNLRVAIGRRDDTRQFRDAFARRDNATIGALLGYPSCCIAFFSRVCIDDGCRDTTWHAALEAGALGSTIDISPAPGASLLLRWLGVRLVPHLACAFDCAATAAHAAEFAALGRATGAATEVGWIEEMLSWPIEWSALHGVAEVRTPVVKIMTSTDETAEKRIVRSHGSRYPGEGARGIAFPYPRTAATHVDNGFSTSAAMEAAHGPLVELAAAALSATPGAVLDLGCGNGVLLAKIAARVPVAAYGIEADAAKVVRARALHRNVAFTTGDLFSNDGIWDRPYGLVVVSSARLSEADDLPITRLAAHLGRCAAKVLVYAYGTTPFDEQEITESCRLRVIDRSARARAILCEPLPLM
ncbi:MAG TPA: methionine biosynthesis protein MetW [Thermoanaerobaculia bacterium]|nr:methionine biosynthesis protein MetW [Thermoanaerobaculia bacterium]